MWPVRNSRGAPSARSGAAEHQRLRQDVDALELERGRLCAEEERLERLQCALLAGLSDESGGDAEAEPGGAPSRSELVAQNAQLQRDLAWSLEALNHGG